MSVSAEFGAHGGEDFFLRANWGARGKAPVGSAEDSSTGTVVLAARFTAHAMVG